MGYRVVTNSLQHHGIQGMHWGDRNGPPYPLGTKTHNRIVNRDKADKKRNKDDEQVHNRFHLSDNKKKAIKVGAAIVGTAIVAYGGYRLAKSGKLNKFIEIGKKATNLAGSVNMSSSHKPNKKVPQELSKALQEANPYKNKKCSNCVPSSLAGSMRRIFGMECTATDKGPFNLHDVIEECFEGANLKTLTNGTKFSKSKEDADAMLIKFFGNDAKGVISVKWKKDSPLSRVVNNKDGLVGHAFNFEIVDGKVTYQDYKLGREGSIVLRYLSEIDPASEITLANLANATPIMEKLRKYLQFA